MNFDHKKIYKCDVCVTKHFLETTIDSGYMKILAEREGFETSIVLCGCNNKLIKF